MAMLKTDDLEPFRERLLSKALQLHESLGVSPRPELAAGQLVEGALALGLRNQTAYQGCDEQALGDWLVRLLENHVNSGWNDAVASYHNVLSGYARVRLQRGLGTAVSNARTGRACRGGVCIGIEESRFVSR